MIIFLNCCTLIFILFVVKACLISAVVQRLDLVAVSFTKITDTKGGAKYWSIFLGSRQITSIRLIKNLSRRKLSDEQDITNKLCNTGHKLNYQRTRQDVFLRFKMALFVCLWQLKQFWTKSVKLKEFSASLSNDGQTCFFVFDFRFQTSRVKQKHKFDPISNDILYPNENNFYLEKTCCSKQSDEFNYKKSWQCKTIKMGIKVFL